VINDVVNRATLPMWVGPEKDFKFLIIMFADYT